ncbi:hypothetical protein PI125_g22639 [Phytophthora idaei]|nr:hypothetical protein PI125_g22639 [Phytophthora idaei]
MKKPMWVTGMQKLGDKVGDRLGFKRIKLQCDLKELLVYGPGEKVDKHQESKKDGENVAAFLPHYTVYFADAPHAREEVTSGFQLILKYSLSLPSEMQHLKDAKGDKPLSEELAEVSRQIEPEDECFALLLEGHYKEEDIQSRGVDALSKMDKTRYRALLEANNLVPEDKALESQMEGKGAIWQEYDREDSVTWYSIDGKKYGDAIRTMYVSTIKGFSEEEVGPPTSTPTFLSPGRLTLSQI